MPCHAPPFQHNVGIKKHHLVDNNFSVQRILYSNRQYAFNRVSVNLCFYQMAQHIKQQQCTVRAVYITGENSLKLF